MARRETSRGSSDTLVTGGSLSPAATSVHSPMTETSRPGRRPRASSVWSTGWSDGAVRHHEAEPGVTARRDRALDRRSRAARVGSTGAMSSYGSPCSAAAAGRVHEPPHVVEVALDVVGRVPDDHEPVVTGLGELVDGQPRRHREVQIDAVQSRRVLRDADEHDGHRQGRGHRDALVVRLDVHEHDRVAQRAAGEAAETGGALVRRDEQHVVIARPRRVRDRLDEGQRTPRIRAGVERDHEPDDARALTGQRARTRVRLVGEVLDRLEHAPAGRSEIGRLPVSTYDTVLCETPATRATSLLVNFGITNLPIQTAGSGPRRRSIRIVDAYR